jgi:hypothetical protein
MGDGPAPTGAGPSIHCLPGHRRVDRDHTRATDSLRGLASLGCPDQRWQRETLTRTALSSGIPEESRSGTLALVIKHFDPRSCRVGKSSPCGAQLVVRAELGANPVVRERIRRRLEEILSGNRSQRFHSLPLGHKRLRRSAASRTICAVDSRHANPDESHHKR